jgi:hypothetical protein
MIFNKKKGIYEWEFKGDLTRNERNLDFQGFSPKGKKVEKK